MSRRIGFEDLTVNLTITAKIELVKVWNDTVLMNLGRFENSGFRNVKF